LEIGSFYNSIRVKQLSFIIFETIQLIHTMEVNGTRNCLVTDTLLNIRKSDEWIRKW